jgi:hypothetical protein
MLDVLLGDEPVLSPMTRIYQRLIAGDDEEATELALGYLDERPLDAVYDQILIPALAEAESDWHRGKLDEVRHARIRQGLTEIVQALGEKQLADDHKADDALMASKAKGRADGAAAALENPPTRLALPPGVVVNVRCLPAHDEADRIVGLMVAQVLERRGYAVAVASADALASDLAASLDSRQADVVVVSALPPKAALHARYLLKLITSRNADLRIVVGLWTNNRPGLVVEFDNVQTATSLDALHKHFDQITPMILLGKTPAPAEDAAEILSGHTAGDSTTVITTSAV